MKVIITSDTHENGDAIKSLVDFAKENSIDTILDCGDLHGNIESYKGINLHTVYWEDASGAMDRYDFNRGVDNIEGVVHRNGSVFNLDDLLIFIQHNLADYNDIIPENDFNRAKSNFDRGSEFDGKKLVLFGHTHNFHFLNDGEVVAINPSSLMQEHAFVVFDTDDFSIEYRNFSETIAKIDGKNPEYTRVRNMSSSGNRFIGQLKSGNEAFIIDGEKQLEHKLIKSIEGFTERKPIYIAVQDNDKEILVNGIDVSREFKEIKKVYNSYTTGLVGFVGVNDNGKEIFVNAKNNKESVEFDVIKDSFSTEPYVFRNRVAFLAQKFVGEDENGEKLTHDLLVVNNKVKAEYKSIYNMLIDGKNAIVSGQKENEKCVINFNGKETKEYDGIHNMKLLDDKLVFIAKEGDKQFVVFNEVEGEGFQADKYNDQISDISLVDGKLTYIVTQQMGDQYNSPKRSFVVHDGVQGPAFEGKGYEFGIKKIQMVDGDLSFIVNEVSDGLDKVYIGEKLVAESKGINDFKKLDDGKIAVRIGGFNSVFKIDGQAIECYNTMENLVEAYNKGEINLPVGCNQNE